jgi:hypothetical protein
MRLETETIDKLFLELSQFAQAETRKELDLRKEVERLRAALTQYGRHLPNCVRIENTGRPCLCGLDEVFTEGGD